LNRELGFSDAETQAKQPSIKIVALQADGKSLGLVVEDICDTEEIVVKPVGKQLSGIDLFSGATITGEGRVALILDIQGLALRAHLDIGGERIEAERERNQGGKVALTTLLLFKSVGESRMVIPLSQVSRLEEFKREEVEKATARDGVLGAIVVNEHVTEVLDVERIIHLGDPSFFTTVSVTLLPTPALQEN